MPSLGQAGCVKRSGPQQGSRPKALTPVLHPGALQPTGASDDVVEDSCGLVVVEELERIDAQPERLHRLAEWVRLIGHFALKCIPGIGVVAELQ